MVKSEKKLLEEIIKLLRELLVSRKLFSYKLKAYNPALKSRSRVGYKPKLKISRYFGGHLQSGYRSKPSYSPIPKSRSSSSYAPKPWKEPMQYRPKERLVYDPEVKRILKSIEQKLSSEPDVEEILRHLESNPELYDKISEGLLEKINGELYEKPEANEPEEKLTGETERMGEYEVGKENLEVEDKEVEEVEEKINFEPLFDKPEIHEDLEESLDVELPTENNQDVEPKTDSSLPEPSEEVIEQLEAQDLSSLEAELYQEPIEVLEPEIDELEPEPGLETYEDVKVETQMIKEEMDGPVFWQHVENELIEKWFKRPELRPEPEVDDYGY